MDTNAIDKEVKSLRLTGDGVDIIAFAKIMKGVVNHDKPISLYIDGIHVPEGSGINVMDSIKVILQSIRYFDSVAVVTDKSWIGYVFELRSRVLGTELKVFQSADQEEAKLWAEC